MRMKIASNLYLISLSTSYRELFSRKEEAEKEVDEYKKCKILSAINDGEKANEWFKNICPECNKIGALNFDDIKFFGENEDKKQASFDGLFYDFSGEKLSLLIEMKNCDRAILYEKYIKDSENDSIAHKAKGSRNLFYASINMNGKLNGEQLVSNTHIVIVYNGKNNMPAKTHNNKTHRAKVEQANGKQCRSSSVKFTRDKGKDLLAEKKLSETIKALSFSECQKSDFPVPAEPKIAKKETKRTFSLFSAQDFAELIRKGFFDHWNWGEYAPYIFNGRCSI